MSQTINSVTTLDIRDGVAVVTIDSPPVNALSAAVRQGLDAALAQVLPDAGVKAVVIACAGRTFFAGADITEFGKPVVKPDLHDLQRTLEASTKPIVAAIHGTALGGGLELALTCHYRIAVPGAKMGLPEVHLGLLPGAGGTQRLPRLIGPSAALDMMVTGKQMGARAALAAGLIDVIAQGDDLAAEAVAYAGALADAGAALRLIRDEDARLAEARDNPGLFTDYRKANRRLLHGFKAPENIIRAVEAAVFEPFEQGLKSEWRLFEELMASRESAAQRYIFFAERETSRVPGLGREVQPAAIRTAAVIGAGTMGGGIAMNFLNVGVPVMLVDRSQEALDRGVAVVRKNYEVTVKKGRMSEAELEARMALLKPALDYDALADVDLVIEAVFEDIELKKKIFAELERKTRPDAILASNTSFLDLDAIAGATGRPEQVVGLHFFSPANVMKLLEIVRGERTSDAVLATALAVARTIAKTPVVSGVCHGFIANRMMAPRMLMAEKLILEGPLPWDIDRVMTAYGFPMGPFSMIDLVGLDVIGWDRENSASRSVQEILCEEGRWGQKRGAGYYEYGEDRRAAPSPHVEAVIRGFAERSGVAPRALEDEAILEALLFPVVNEGARILEEGIALRASDVDVALILGYGWPVWTGGPLFWADGYGLGRIVDGLNDLAARYGEAYAPSALLTQLAESGGSLSAWSRQA